MTGSQEIGEKVNILLVDDQPGKLVSYELILNDLDENLLKANSAQEALEILIKTDVALILIDVCMPDLDGFELAQMIREHPRFRNTAIIFVSAIHLSDLDSLKGYELGGVDYVPVPVVPAVLRAKVRVFVELYRKTRELARLNNELERRVAERTEELQGAIQHQELLAREVDHRARNALAVIQSIVSLTPAADGEKFVAAIQGRIRAMATAHTLLSNSRWQGADLLVLVNEELAPYTDCGSVAVDGESVSILPTVAQSLALVLHELATNAAKYGALSQAGGRLAVSWRLEGNEMRLDWIEECGFAIPKQSKPGFGSRVIEASIGQLGGHIARKWPPDGLRCTITLPGKHFRPLARARPKSNENVKPDTVRNDLRNQRILILDDEPLITMMTSHMVSELGAAVVGPFSAAGEARAALSHKIDAALLDVNTGEQFSYELADELLSRGVPIAFLTGYQASAIEQRFADVPVLTKPVDKKELSVVLNSLLAKQEKDAISRVAL